MTTTIYNGNTRQAMHVRSIAYCLRVLTNTAKRRRTTASANDGRTARPYDTAVHRAKTALGALRLLRNYLHLQFFNEAEP